MLTASSSDGPAFHTRGHTQNTSDSTSPPHIDAAPCISQEPTTTPKPITADRLDTLLQMQRTDPFCKCISRRLLNGKAPHHEFDTFTHVKGLLYKHIIPISFNMYQILDDNYYNEKYLFQTRSIFTSTHMPQIHSI